MARTARFTETLPPTNVSPEQAQLVHQQADEQGVSLAEVVRNALDVYFDQQREDATQAPSEG